MATFKCQIITVEAKMEQDRITARGMTIRELRKTRFLIKNKNCYKIRGLEKITEDKTIMTELTVKTDLLQLTLQLSGLVGRR